MILAPLRGRLTDSQGNDYVTGMRDVLGDKFDKMVVTASYEPLLPLRRYSRRAGIRHSGLLDGQYH
jgi:hypothetical protein